MTAPVSSFCSHCGHPQNVHLDPPIRDNGCSKRNCLCPQYNSPSGSIPSIPKGTGETFRLLVVSDGSLENTFLMDENGRKLDNVVSFKLEASRKGGIKCFIELRRVGINVQLNDEDVIKQAAPIKRDNASWDF